MFLQWQVWIGTLEYQVPSHFLGHYEDIHLSVWETGKQIPLFFFFQNSYEVSRNGLPTRMYHALVYWLPLHHDFCVPHSHRIQQKAFKAKGTFTSESFASRNIEGNADVKNGIWEPSRGNACGMSEPSHGAGREGQMVLQQILTNVLWSGSYLRTIWLLGLKAPIVCLYQGILEDMKTHSEITSGQIFPRQGRKT